jgi:hypothetical protein
MTQRVFSGSIPTELGNPKDRFTYRPVSIEDLSAAVEAAFGKFGEVKNNKYTLGGSKDFTLAQIVNVLEEASGKGAGSTKLRGSLLGLGLSDFVEEFFVGIAHDKNFVRMAKFYERNPYLAETLTKDDFFAKTGLKNGPALDEVFGAGANKLQETDFVFPLFTDYKLVSLN